MASNVGITSRPKGKGAQEIDELCADCGATDAEWASINRGVVVCGDCCSVHRSLGRHVSQIKSCNDKDWHPHLWNLVCSLSKGGANSVWEHTLLDPTLAKTANKKPSPNDPVHPTKADFIRAKHQMLAFVIQPPSCTGSSNAGNPSSSAAAVSSSSGGEEDGKAGDEAELLAAAAGDEASQELHSSVRTANLQTSLRLLSQGADPNYFHKGRGNYPLHVASSSAQAEQVELLLVYGAVPQCLDTSNNTPAHCASTSSHKELSLRLTDVQYELVNRLIQYLSDQHLNTAPHSTPYSSLTNDTDDNIEKLGVDGGGSGAGPVFLSPQLIVAHQHATDHARQARARLIRIPSALLEELAADLYDEVDRRELEVVCCGSSSGGGTGKRCTVPFLPVNPLLSSTRNQARQKLARLKESEFCSLIVDLLVESKRRAAIVSTGSSAIPTLNAALAELRDEDPLYDSVCSEDDYCLVEQLDKQPTCQQKQQTNSNRSKGTSLEEDYQEVIESPAEEQPFSFAPTTTTPVSEHSTTKSTKESHPPATTDLSPTSENPSSLLSLPESQSESNLVVVSSALSCSQQHQQVSSTFTPSLMSPSLSSTDNNNQQRQGVSLEQYKQMQLKLESSERTIRELQHDNQHMKTKLDHLSSTVLLLQDNSNTPAAAVPPPPPPAPTTAAALPHFNKVSKLREENSSLRSLASPSPPPMGSSSSNSPTVYHTPYHSLPPLHNGDAASPAAAHQSLNSSRSYVSMPYYHHNNSNHHHQRSDSYPSNYSTDLVSSSTTNQQHNFLSSNRFHYPYPGHSTPTPEAVAAHYDYQNNRPSLPHLPPPLRFSSQPSHRHNSCGGEPNSSPIANINSNNNTTSMVGSLTVVGHNNTPPTTIPTRPYSMFETREKRAGLDKDNLRRDVRVPSGSSVSNTVSCNTYESICNSSEWDGGGGTAEHQQGDFVGRLAGPHHYHQRSSSFSDELYSRTDSSVSGSSRTPSLSRYHTPSQLSSSFINMDMPSQNEVVGLTDSITRGIQELLCVAQSVGEVQPPYTGKHRQQFVLCAEKITRAVSQMADAFPRSSESGLPSVIHEALLTLIESTVHLTSECNAGSSTQTLIQAGFGIAKATKNLVTCFQ